MSSNELLYFAARIDPEKVYFLKFILEGYDNLFLSSTLHRRQGIVLIRAVQGEEETLMSVLESVATHVGLQCVEEV